MSNTFKIRACLAKVVAICVFVSLTTFPSVEARIRRFKWEVKYEYKSPDCNRKLAITINGQTPGPTITATRGDTVVVELKNSLLTENVAIHWHGIRQVRFHAKSCYTLRRYNINFFFFFLVTLGIFNYLFYKFFFTDWNTLG